MQNLDVDRPFVLVDQRQHALQAAQANARVHLELRAHVRRAVEDALFQRAPRALIDIVRRKGALRLGDLPDGFFQVALLRLAAVENAGFVEMNMGLDETRRDQAPLEIDFPAIRGKPRLDRRDALSVDADVECRAVAADDASVAQNEIH